MLGGPNSLNTELPKHACRSSFTKSERIQHDNSLRHGIRWRRTMFQFAPVSYRKRHPQLQCVLFHRTKHFMKRKPAERKRLLPAAWIFLAVIVLGLVIAIRIRLLGIPLERDEVEY